MRGKKKARDYEKELQDLNEKKIRYENKLKDITDKIRDVRAEQSAEMTDALAEVMKEKNMTIDDVVKMLENQ